ncbi:GntP family permease [Affinibrenneria salicis]|uniref:GntP family permease n=1 Tax=Affinibrenneria salicis TaxID=2590031 RepID=A0A5J5G537_9GAMM|nr:GntP family permease [Affinibrenneria salicis]KAA9001984.1 GntP family permease [Affinibrenneria salicis]
MDILTTSLLVLGSIIAIIILTSKLKINAFASLFIVSFLLAIFTIPYGQLVDTLKTGFGQTMGAISFIIIFGAIIAIVLEKSGGALSIANYIYAKTGKERAPVAMAMTGFIPGLTIFCDTGFIILSGVARTFSAKSKVPMPLIASILGCSLYSVHCLVPTHPGALAAAGTMNVNLGYFIIAGVAFSIPAAVAAYLWSTWMTKGKNYPPAVLELDEIKEVNLPAVKLALLPIVLPLMLIALSSLVKSFAPGSQNGLITAIHFVGNPVIALLFGAISSFLLLKQSNTDFNSIIEGAIAKAGPILIITAAGGMFGLVIKETGVAGELGKYLGVASVGLFIPFFIAAILKTAQGSSTIAIITTAAIIEPILGDFGLDSAMGRLFATLAMGAGSMLASHANDSYFWVVTKFSNIEADTSLKVFSTATIVMSVTAFISIWIASMFFI